jgi:RNA polymerase sigma-70 factor (ECF subfamily)
MVDSDAKRDPLNLLTHAGWVRGLVRALVLDPGQVDDVVQQTYLAAIEGPPRRMLDPRAWLGGVARNLARDANRRDTRRRQREKRSARPEGLPSADELVEKAELQRKVVKAVVELTEPYRSTLLLHFFEELSAEEMASRLGVPSSTVRNRLKRGLDQLRERFDREEGGDRSAWALCLLPLVRTGGGLEAATIASATTVSAGSVTTGGTTMIAKGWIAVAAVGLVAVGGTTAVMVKRDTAAAPAAESPALVAPEEEQEEMRAEQTPLTTPGPQAAAQRTSATSPPLGLAAHVLRGSVVDARGRPIEGAEVFVGGFDNPFGGERIDGAAVVREGHVFRHEIQGWNRIDAAERRSRGVAIGRLLETDAEGLFEARFAGEQRAFVFVTRSVGVRPEAEMGEWYDTPSVEIALTAARVPTATVSLRVLDETTGEYLPGFEGVIRARSIASRGEDEEHWAEEFLANGTGRAEMLFELEGGPGTFDVTLRQPPWASAERELVVSGGTHQDVVLSVRSEGGFEGRVTDTFGQPVEGALVFWGSQLRMRDRQATSRAFVPERVQDAVTTDAGGLFRLPGRAEEVSVWHAELSPATALVADAGEIELPSRGSVRGRVLNEHGVAVAGNAVLDRTREVALAADGTFEIANVEAGPHGLTLPGERSGTVVVPAGDSIEVDVDWIGDVTVEMTSGGVPYPTEEEVFGGVVFGAGEFHLVREWGNRGSGTSFTLHNAIPDTYTIISRSGRIASFEVSGKTATVELGDADLTVRARPGRRIYVIPAGALEPIPHWAVKMAIEVPEGGEVVWSPLGTGSWQVGTPDEGVLATVEVTGTGAEITLE